MVTINDPTFIKLKEFDIKNGAGDWGGGSIFVINIKFESHLSFVSYVSSSYKKASQKLHALAKLVDPIIPEKRYLMKAFITPLLIRLLPVYLNILHSNYSIYFIFYTD